MDRRNKNRKSGFSLVEVVIALALLGMVLLAVGPVITTGQRIFLRTQRKAEAEVLGDRAFEYIAEGKEQNEISIGLKEKGFELMVETEPLDREWVSLRLELVENNAVVYEREEVISAWNMERFKTLE